LVARRYNSLGPAQTADSFLLASYFFEASIKSVAIALVHGLRGNAADIAYRVGYVLVRADSLGQWEAAIREMTTPSIAGFLPIDFRPLVAWATKKRTAAEDPEFRAGYNAAMEVLRLAGGSWDSEKKPSVLNLATIFVQIRNSTKAHGALGPDFFAAANEKYVTAINSIFRDCPIFHWDWIHLSIPSKTTKRAVRCISESPQYLPESELESIAGGPAGMYFSTANRSKPYNFSTLFQTDLECRRFFLPNGGIRDPYDAEFIDYSTGEKQRTDVSFFAIPPSPLPPSETEGLEAIDIQTNILGNLPLPPRDYVERPELQDELVTRLLDRNHNVITLHGFGGMGKTSLALFALYSIATIEPSPFEYILWFSARDIDLRVAGPTRVRTAVIDLQTVTKTFGRLFSTPTTTESFAKVLADPGEVSAKSILFVFDNFESIRDLVGLHSFLDTHTHLPNKVLMTSRERRFKADFPIEVRGMEWPEAKQMLNQQAEVLGITNIVSDEVIEEIHEATDGHPYVMRVLLGEIAKERRVIPLRQLIPRRYDVVNSVFERSFDRLTSDGRKVFLVVSNWKSVVFEIALIAVLSSENVDVARGADECVQLSILHRDYTESGQATYSAPELARAFGRKKLEGDPDRIELEECVSLVQNFGPLASASVASSQGQDKVVQRFVKWCFREAAQRFEESREVKNAPGTRRVEIPRLDALLESMATVVPVIWLEVATFRRQFGLPRTSIESALRKAVEENPASKEARVMRADFARSIGDDITQVSSLISAVEVAPADLPLIMNAAAALTSFIDRRKEALPPARRGIYLASVRSNMERLCDKLDAVGLSRLAWLFLLEGNEAKAREYANMGLRRNPQDPDCKNILARLDGNKRRR
jgi:hypothetical protein